MNTLARPLRMYKTFRSVVRFSAIEVDPVFTPNPGEIAEVLEFPVTRLLHVEEPRTWTREDRTLHGFVYELDGHTIWGATGRILHELLELMREDIR